MVSRDLGIAYGLAICCVVSACASQWSQRSENAFTYDLVVTDEPAFRRFRLRLTSTAVVPFCVGLDSWPNVLGQVPVDSHRITLRWRNGNATAKAGFEGYCPGDCEMVIPVKATLDGEVKYEAFGDPEWVFSLPDRELEVTLTPFRCHGRVR